MLFAYSMFLFSAIFPTSSITASQLQKTALSNNYLEHFALYRAGQPPNDSHSELEEIVSAHNQRLTQNPAAKNRNRIVYLTGPSQYKEVRFSVAPGTVVVDGAGKTMGYLQSNDPRVELNFGQHKSIAGKDHVMVFGAQTTASGPVTGWIPASALLPSPERSQFAQEISTVVANTAALGDSPETYQVSCGAAGLWNAGRLKILPKVDDRLEKHEAASDYVARPGGFCYLLTSLPGNGGVATDTLSSGVIFVPDAGMPHVDVPLYLPVDSTSSELDAWNSGRLPHVMEFRYGRVGTRYGWIASADLLPAGDTSTSGKSR
jgi:hypothetical protein